MHEILTFALFLRLIMPRSTPKLPRMNTEETFHILNKFHSINNSAAIYTSASSQSVQNDAQASYTLISSLDDDQLANSVPIQPVASANTGYASASSQGEQQSNTQPRYMLASSREDASVSQSAYPENDTPIYANQTENHAQIYAPANDKPVYAPANAAPRYAPATNANPAQQMQEANVASIVLTDYFDVIKEIASGNFGTIHLLHLKDNQSLPDSLSDLVSLLDEDNNLLAKAPIIANEPTVIKEQKIFAESLIAASKFHILGKGKRVKLSNTEPENIVLFMEYKKFDKEHSSNAEKFFANWKNDKEYFDPANLNADIARNNKEIFNKYNDIIIAWLFDQIADALSYIHLKQNLVHYDIALRNVLISAFPYLEKSISTEFLDRMVEEMAACLCDFGLTIPIGDYKSGNSTFPLDTSDPVWFWDHRTQASPVSDLYSLKIELLKEIANQADIDFYHGYDLQIRYPNDSYEFNLCLNTWANEHQSDDVLLMFSPDSNAWKAYLIKNIQGKQELIERVIDVDSPLGKKLQSIDQNILASYNQKNLTTLLGELKNLLDTDTLFAGYTQRQKILYINHPNESLRECSYAAYLLTGGIRHFSKVLPHFYEHLITELKAKGIDRFNDLLESYKDVFYSDRVERLREEIIANEPSVSFEEREKRCVIEEFKLLKEAQRTLFNIKSSYVQLDAVAATANSENVLRPDSKVEIYTNVKDLTTESDTQNIFPVTQTTSLSEAENLLPHLAYFAEQKAKEAEHKAKETNINNTTDATIHLAPKHKVAKETAQRARNIFNKKASSAKLLEKFEAATLTTLSTEDTQANNEAIKKITDETEALLQKFETTKLTVSSDSSKPADTGIKTQRVKKLTLRFEMFAEQRNLEPLQSVKEPALPSEKFELQVKNLTKNFQTFIEQRNSQKPKADSLVQEPSLQGKKLGGRVKNLTQQQHLGFFTAQSNNDFAPQPAAAKKTNHSAERARQMFRK